MNIEEIIATQQESSGFYLFAVARACARLEILTEGVEFKEGSTADIAGGSLSFNLESRQEFAAIRANCPKGIWKREPSWDKKRFRYSMTIGGVDVSCIVSELPSSCKSVTRTITHAAVPERIETVEELVCEKGEEGVAESVVVENNSDIPF